eukprot:Rmarinus@m.29763
MIVKKQGNEGSKAEKIEKTNAWFLLAVSFFVKVTVLRKEDDKIIDAITRPLFTVPLLLQRIPLDCISLISSVLLTVWIPALRRNAAEYTEAWEQDSAKVCPEEAMYFLGNIAFVPHLLSKLPSSRLPKTLREQPEQSEEALGGLVNVAADLVSLWVRLCRKANTVEKSNLGATLTFHPLFHWSMSRVDPAAAVPSVAAALLDQIAFLWKYRFLGLAFDRFQVEPGSLETMPPEAIEGVVTSCQLYLCLQKVLSRKACVECDMAIAFHLPCIPAKLWRVVQAVAACGADMDDNYSSTSTSVSQQSNFISKDSTTHRRKRKSSSLLSLLSGLMPSSRSSKSLLGTWSSTSSLTAAPGTLGEWSNAVHDVSAVPVDLFVLFCRGALPLFQTLDDSEVHDKERPFLKRELCDMSKALNSFLFSVEMFPRKEVTESNEVSSKYSELCGLASGIVGNLFRRHCRRSLGPDKLWKISDCESRSFAQALRNKDPAAWQVLYHIPHAVPFEFRLETLRDFIKQYRGGEGTPDPRRRSFYLQVSRKNLVGDAISGIQKLPKEKLKNTEIRIQFVNELGLAEAGIDQAGVSKEFVEEVSKVFFSPDYGLFCATEHTKQLYPNPHARIICGGDYLAMYEVAGVVIGKALCDGINVDVPFTDFVLLSLAGGTPSINELSSFDPVLYKNLICVKEYDGDVEDLGLSFTVTDEVLGQMVTKDLIPGGGDVTNRNRLEYVHYMADYHLNGRIRQHLQAFIRGFLWMVPRSLLRCFSVAELRLIIAGVDADFDLDDLRRHTVYYGGYHDNHQSIRWLWKTVREMESDDKRAFLKFVTSSSKPPLSGFGSLQPPFSVRCVQPDETEATEDAPSIMRSLGTLMGMTPGIDTRRLPTSSTCFNLLKLPLYKSRSVLKERLLYAIRSGAGFELS